MGLLSVWVEAGNPAEIFWQQTPRTYQAIMEGCARRERRQAAHAMAIGWHAANFARAGKHLRNLDHYLRKLEPQKDQTADEAAAIWQGFAERGLVTITERPKRPKEA